VSSIIRSLAFLRKEIIAVWRQPRLMATLVLGPFLILFLFGLWYRDTPEPFRTLVVADEAAAEIADPARIGDALGSGIELVGVTDDLDGATESLMSGDVDLVLVAPEDGLDALSRGEQAVFSIIHTEIDPVLTGSIDLIGRLSVDRRFGLPAARWPRPSRTSRTLTRRCWSAPSRWRRPLWWSLLNRRPRTTRQE
jgi:ABC-2 type transport system permease protein